MSVELETRIKAEGLSLAIQQATKQEPVVQYFPDGHAEIYFKDSQIPLLRKFFEDVLKKAGGEQKIKIHAEAIVIPVLLKKALPFIAALIVSGIILGRLSKK